MKWIIVDLFQDSRVSASKTNESTTVDVDAIESVTQVRRRVNRNNVRGWSSRRRCFDQFWKIFQNSGNQLWTQPETVDTLPAQERKVRD